MPRWLCTHPTYGGLFSSSNFYNIGLKKLDKMWFLSTGSQKMCKAGM